MKMEQKSSQHHRLQLGLVNANLQSQPVPSLIMSLSDGLFELWEVEISGLIIRSNVPPFFADVHCIHAYQILIWKPVIAIWPIFSQSLPMDGKDILMKHGFEYRKIETTREPTLSHNRPTKPSFIPSWNWLWL